MPRRSAITAIAFFVGLVLVFSTSVSLIRAVIQPTTMSALFQPDNNGTALTRLQIIRHNPDDIATLNMTFYPSNSTIHVLYHNIKVLWVHTDRVLENCTPEQRKYLETLTKITLKAEYNIDMGRDGVYGVPITPTVIQDIYIEKLPPVKSIVFEDERLGALSFVQYPNGTVHVKNIEARTYVITLEEPLGGAPVGVIEEITDWRFATVLLLIFIVLVIILIIYFAPRGR